MESAIFLLVGINAVKCNDGPFDDSNRVRKYLVVQIMINIR